ncbi:MAG: hypothetical protein ABIO83_11300 [Ilumatobacteraceae bacterium]
MAGDVGREWLRAPLRNADLPRLNAVSARWVKLLNPRPLSSETIDPDELREAAAAIYLYALDLVLGTSLVADETAEASEDEIRLLFVAVELQTVADLHARFHRMSEIPAFDVQTRLAVLTAMWVHARSVIEFLLGSSGQGSVNVRTYLGEHHWRTPKGSRTRLEGYRTTITNQVVHLKVHAKGDAFNVGMPDDLVTSFRSVLDEFERHGTPGSGRSSSGPQSSIRRESSSSHQRSSA